MARSPRLHGARHVALAVAVLLGLVSAFETPAASKAVAPSGSSRPGVARSAVPLVGVNEQWDTQGDLDEVIAPGDLSKIAATGAEAVRIPVRCTVVHACRFDRRNDDSIDYRSVTTWDFTRLDHAVSYLRARGYTPVIGLHPGSRMFRPGWIVDDPMWASTRAYVDTIVRHLDARFGPLPYSMYETELDTSLDRHDSVYHYVVATGFTQFAAQLSRLYGGDLAAYNRVHATAWPSFDAVPIPTIGSAAGVPPDAIDNPATYDLRRVIGSLSAERYSVLGRDVHALSPGSEYWGPTVQLQSLDDHREVHTPTALTPVGPTLSDLAAQPGIDVLSVDGYRNDDRAMAAAEWQIAAKIAALAGKKVAITEIGGTSLADLTAAASSVTAGASNLRAVFVWEGRDRPGVVGGYGLIDGAGNPKPARLQRVKSLFDAVTADVRFRTYRAGSEAVYYPEWAVQVVQNGKLTFTKPLTVMADLFATGRRPEPVVDREIVAGATWPRLTLDSLYLSHDAMVSLRGHDQRLVAFQYAAYRTGFDHGRAIDEPLEPARLGFTVSRAESAARPSETVVIDGTTIPVTGQPSLAGYPFVHLVSAGTAVAYGRHGDGAPLGVRAADGSVWLDEYPGAGSIPVLYG